MGAPDDNPLLSEQAARREQIVSRFEDAWASRQRPVIDDYLPADGEQRQQVLVELIHIDLEWRLKLGEPIRVEEYLQQYAELADDDTAVVELLQAEYTLRRRRETGLQIDEYQRRFPRYAQAPGLGLGTETSPSPRFPIRLNCPHCHNPIAIVEDEPGEDVVCPSCGSSFRLGPDLTISWSSDRLPQLGRFKLLERIGSGAFGTVFKARDTELDRMVAVKVPRSGTFTNTTDEDRFVREARSAAQLNHPGIVSVFEVGRGDGFPYLVTEFVAGRTLADAIQSRRFEYCETAEIVAQIADALDHAHRRGVVHRDIKPSNIMLADMTEDDLDDLTLSANGAAAGGCDEKKERKAAKGDRRRHRPRLMDFGLARHDRAEIVLTVAGQILGTPAYMSPEQARGEAHLVDGRSDVYSLGVILFQLLTGQLPFSGPPIQLVNRVIAEGPPRPRELVPDIPPGLEAVCLKCLAKSPAERYPRAAALVADLRCFLAGQRPSAASLIGAARLRYFQSARFLQGICAFFLTAIVVLAVAAVAKWTTTAQTPKAPEQDSVKWSLIDEANLQSNSPAIKLAAEIARAEEAALSKIAAVSSLARQGWGAENPYDSSLATTNALAAAMEDCTEQVRFETVKSIYARLSESQGQQQLGTVLTKKLAELAHEIDDYGVFLERSTRIRKLATSCLTADGARGEHRPD